jgi:hypothetical protein
MLALALLLPCADVDQADLQILRAFYAGTLGTDHWKQGCDVGWSDPGNNNFCTWAGITCTDNQRNVKGIVIAACDLTNQIPSTPQIPSIFGLKFLDTLFISPGPDQSLSGSIPDDFNMVKPVLKTIQLTGHQFSGEIPLSLYKSVSLQKIDFHSNALQGTLSDAIGGLSQLTYFSAANNKLYGTLPASVSKLRQLTTLGLARNSFAGTIAPISDLPKLQILFLRYNLFVGAIPAVANSTAVFDMDHNRFNSIDPKLCAGEGIVALQKSGGCDQDYPAQGFDTCCLAGNSFADANITAECPALKNCFHGSSSATFSCTFPAFKCVSVQGSAGEYLR